MCLSAFQPWSTMTTSRTPAAAVVPASGSAAPATAAADHPSHLGLNVETYALGITLLVVGLALRKKL